MAAQPKVSILTTVRGITAPLFEICIDSVRNQSMADLEMVVVLDGDIPADADEVLRAKAADDPRIVVVRPGRVGRGKALNIALATARSEFVGIQDADDASHPDRVAVQYDILRSDPDLTLLGTGARVSWGLDQDADWPLEPFARPLTYRRLDREFLVSNPVVHSSVLARTEALRRVGGYDDGRVAQLDYDLLLRLRAEGAEIAVCDLPLVLHRRHPGQNYERMVPSSRAWGSYRLQTSHLVDLPAPQRVGYQTIAATRLVYQILRGVAWHQISRRSAAPAAAG